MSDEAPSGDRAVYVFIEMIALGFVLYAIEEAFKDNSSWRKVAIAMMLGVLFFLLGVYWTKLKSRLRLTWIDRITNDYRYRYGAGVLVIGIIGFYILSSINGLRHDLDTYAMPRSLTREQSEGLQDYLSQHEPHPVTVKVNPLDPEATEYAAQLLNAVKAGGWDADFNTSDSPPNTLNQGLCIGIVGLNAGPPDPKHDPQRLLQEAFKSAQIEVNCGSGSGAGEYKVYLLVGRRPRAIGNQEPVLFRVGRWLERQSR